MGNVIEIRVFGKDDRLKVAAILFDNGYRVEQCSRPRSRPDGTKMKATDYLIQAEDIRDNGAE